MESKPKTFASLKPKIEAAINERLKLPQAPRDPDGFTLLDGFFVGIMQTEHNPSVLVMGGQTVTQVAVVGNRTGVIHYFALRALLPEEPGLWT